MKLSVIVAFGMCNYSKVICIVLSVFGRPCWILGTVH